LTFLTFQRFVGQEIPAEDVDQVERDGDRDLRRGSSVHRAIPSTGKIDNRSTLEPLKQITKCFWPNRSLSKL